MTETRLMAMRFHPSDHGGFWWPAGVRVTAEGEQTGWVDAWDSGITEEDQQALSVAAQEGILGGCPDANTATHAEAKLRSMFPSQGGEANA